MATAWGVNEPCARRLQLRLQEWDSRPAGAIRGGVQAAFGENAPAQQSRPVGEIQGIHFLTMECLKGQSLAELVKTGSPLPQAQVANLVRKMALAEAHAPDVIHRDLKPSNGGPTVKQYIQRNYFAGDRVIVNLLRDGKRMDVPMTLFP